MKGEEIALRSAAPAGVPDRAGGGRGGGEVLLSIVIPTLGEADYLPGLFDDLSRLPVRHEVIVADGGSVDGTVEIARRAGARIVATVAGRGRQLRAGADSAMAPLLCFLHADLRLTNRAIRDLATLTAEPPSEACAFRLQIDAPGLAFRIIERGANLRSRCFGLPYGDQGLIVSRAAYRQAGGYPAIPLMEDVAIVRALRRRVGFRLLEGEVLVSARRWRRDGVLGRTITNLTLLFRYLTGTPPDRLVRHYRPETPTS